MSEALRFNGLPRRRAHLRLAAAAGMLVGAAIATGGLASVLARESKPEVESESSRTLPGGDQLIELELRVREAEGAAARARSALRDARALDPDERESFERRLEQLGQSPLESVRRDYAQQDELDELDESERRSHLRAIASPPREL